MSNFSHDEKLHDEKSYSETKSNPHSSDKTVAFLAALQETQNVLNVLLQAVLYRENADSCDGNNLELTTSLESGDEFKENISDQNSNEDKRNVNDLERPRSEQKVFQTLNTVKDKEGQMLLEDNNTSCEDAINLMEQMSLSLTEYENNKDLETTDISKVEEIEKLLLFSQTKYSSCEKKVNAILNQFSNIHDDTQHDEACSDHLYGITQSALEPSNSTIQKEILIRGDSDHRKATVLHLPPDAIPNSPSRCEKEVVGDDVAKTKTHILCECEQAGVAGGAVPIVTSFTVSHENVQIDNNNLDENKFEDHNIMSKPDLSQKELIQQQPKCSHIPKLKHSVHSVKDADKIGSLGRTGKQRCLVSASTPKNHNKDEGNESNKILSSKMLTLQERLRTTTSLIRQKMSNSGENEDEKKKKDQNEKLQLRFDEESFDRGKRHKKLRNELSKSIKSVVRDIGGLKEITDLSAQTLAIDHLYNCIKDLKRLSDELNDIADDEKTFAGGTSRHTSQDSSVESGYPAKAKDHKIYIKFLPTKHSLKKRKCCNIEVQTESKGYDQTSDSEYLTPEKKSNGENGIKGVDSMDGMFIPSSEEPPRIYEDEDDDGLDITITFPEFQQDVLHEADSHLSVCFSDISAEALGRLKRCPKEFTLRMDFIHGKMFFQSGKSPANSFSIGPDLKITECVIDNKMSDIISIKPSTECMYNSQLIPVEGNKRKSSIRTLKSTDSELFNVVSLPTINRKASGNTKSCITFKNDRYISAGCLLSDRRSYRSMPQIPSLTKILEEPAMESASTSRAAVMNSEKKSRNRTLPKKKTNASLENLSEV